MDLFATENYRAYIRERQKALPKKGWGFVGRLAAHLGVSQVQVSQVLGGKKDFTLEQAVQVGKFLALSELEGEYFLWLVMRSRSGSVALTKVCEERLAAIRERSKKLGERLPADRGNSLSEEERGIFYSHYLYSAVRLFTSIGAGKTLEEVAEQFGIGRPRAMKILDFLVSAGLCVREGRRYVMRVSRTYVGRDSPHLSRHHANWRFLALNSVDSLLPEEIMVTSPVSLSRKDFELVQRKLLGVVQEISSLVRDSDAEVVACWNIDWFALKGEALP